MNGRAGMNEKKTRLRSEVVSPMRTSIMSMIAVYPIYMARKDTILFL